MVYEYEWSGYKYAVPASVVGAECEKIEAENGSVTSEGLVESARSEDSSLHKLFEWDDSVAGEKWRNQQAKVMLSCLKVVVSTEKSEKPIQIRAYLNPNYQNSRAEYFNIQRTMQDADLKAGVLIRAERELTAFTDKYRTLKELDSIIEAIDNYFNSKED